MMKNASIPTKLQKRSLELKKKFGSQSIREIPRSTLRVSLGVYKKYVNETIKNKLDQDWVEGMSEKRTLERYSTYKTVRGNIEHIYDNTRGSRLLANARAGCLQTRKFRSRFKNIGATCLRCEREEETQEHVILECEDPPDAECIIRKRLGLHEESTPKMIFDTKVMLEEWV
ncbi:uncharacterized protein LOC108864098 [Galendromus occidentalis]|uniref:Uncharacterized protein LOC108864098 n=1 Tax=Galendromus occidentalis TaxID=34638 RepID=A0AAJ7P9I7_9ACAR|nr:uncharacterized protein LOC108864098 [Galendromus occidentalis]